jgi:hypothetical protein
MSGAVREIFNFRFSIFSLAVAVPAIIKDVRSNWFSQSKFVPGGIRTPNLLIRSQMLYPVELQTLLTVKRGYKS